VPVENSAESYHIIIAGFEVFTAVVMGYKAIYSVESQQTFLRNIAFIFSVEEKVKKEINMKQVANRTYYYCLQTKGSLNGTIFRDVTPYSRVEVHRRFRGKHYL
jgi:hypothetical protein